MIPLLSCGTEDPAASTHARNLQTALNPTSQTLDTAKQRADSQFQTCTYVYDLEFKLRECLVFTHGWAPADAERAIVTYKADLKRLADSLERVQLARYEAERRREDSVRAVARRRRARELAEEQRIARQQAESLAAFMAAFPVVGSKSDRTYFLNSPECIYAATLPEWNMVLFRSEAEAKEAGYSQASKDPRCRVGMPPLGERVR
jgi:hypothetical protein